MFSCVIHCQFHNSQVQIPTSDFTPSTSTYYPAPLFSLQHGKEVKNGGLWFHDPVKGTTQYMDVAEGRPGWFRPTSKPNTLVVGTKCCSSSVLPLHLSLLLDLTVSSQSHAGSSISEKTLLSVKT